LLKQSPGLLVKTPFWRLLRRKKRSSQRQKWIFFTTAEQLRKMNKIMIIQSQLVDYQARIRNFITAKNLVHDIPEGDTWTSACKESSIHAEHFW
jgi:hypothetical protein